MFRFLCSLLQSQVFSEHQQSQLVYILITSCPPLSMNRLLYTHFTAHDLPGSPDQTKWKWEQWSHDWGRRNHQLCSVTTIHLFFYTLVCLFFSLHLVTVRRGSGFWLHFKHNAALLQQETGCTEILFEEMLSFLSRHFCGICTGGFSWTKLAYINIGRNGLWSRKTLQHSVHCVSKNVSGVLRFLECRISRFLGNGTTDCFFHCW